MVYLQSIIDLILKKTEDKIQNVHKIFWMQFVRQFEVNEEFTKEFNRRKAWEKDYYDLAWDNSSVHICLRHNCLKKQLVVETYIKDESIYKTLYMYKDQICKEYGASLTFTHTRGVGGKEGKASKIYNL